jgi:uncharacterized protein (DUF2225 family)
MRRHLNYDVQIKEFHTYEWICPICGEENHVRVSIIKSFLPCPVCNVTFRRDEITSTTWRLLTDRQEKENRIDPVPELDLTNLKDPKS